MSEGRYHRRTHGSSVISVHRWQGSQVANFHHSLLNLYTRRSVGGGLIWGGYKHWSSTGRCGDADSKGN